MIMATKRVRGVDALLSDITNTYLDSTPKRACASKADSAIKQQMFQHGSRGLCLTPPLRTNPSPVLSDPSLHSTTPSVSTNPSPNPSNHPPNHSPSHTLKQLVRDRPEVVESGLYCLQQYIERNTIFEVQKAHAISAFAGAVLNGRKILEACDLEATGTLFAARTIRRWASDMFGDFFAHISNIDDITDEKVEMQLCSGRGRHPKWVSLMTDENFRKEVKEYVLENGYVKGRPNLT